jgi:rare lipoprotein A
MTRECLELAGRGYSVVISSEYQPADEDQTDMKKIILIIAILLCVAHGAAHIASAETVEEGEASYYADSLDGYKTASGELYDKDAFSAAHPSLPFGTKVKVTYLKTGQSVTVVINDRGPKAEDRIIDLSSAAAKKIGLIEAGRGRVKLEVIGP